MLCLVLANECELLLSIECAGGAAAPCRQLLVLCWRRVKTRDRSCVECRVYSTQLCRGRGAAQLLVGAHTGHILLTLDTEEMVMGGRW